MRLLDLVLVAALGGAFSLVARDASAQRLDSTWFLADDSAPGDNRAEVRIDGTEFWVDGLIQGIGSPGDAVVIFYFTDLPTSANADAEQGRVRQIRFSRLSFFIDSDTPGRSVFLEISPEKCAVDAKVQAVEEKGHVTVNCSASDIYSGLTADQEASIAVAFQDNSRVKFKVNDDGSKGSLSIKLQGTAIDED
jgi:hypothetical protein